MNFENWQELWQKQPSPTAPSAETIARTIERVRTGARSFDRTIFWRDMRECVAAVGVSVVFAFVAWARIQEGAPAWDAMLAALLSLGVAGFLVVDRSRAKQRRPAGGGTVIAGLDHAIAELKHQHWLLTHVLWWYLLPLTVSAGLIMGHGVLTASPLWWARATLVLLLCGIMAAVNIPIYWLNQRVAKNELAPRIEELERRRRQYSETGAA